MAIKRNFLTVWAFFVVFFVVQLPGGLKAENEEKSLHRTATAVRINSAPPQLDGVLDDAIWKTAPLHEGFRQQDPDEGELATERTTFQIAYDDEAIYFAVMCYDKEPEKIFSRLVRRDNYVTSDRLDVVLDPHYSRQNAFWFTVYPSGSVTDGTISGGGWWDSTWNGVWEVKTKIHKNGWAAEYKIPYHVLRFAPKEKYTWGLQVSRSISRKKEYALWRLIKKDEPGWVSRFGDLTGIENIHPPHHLELVPYTMGRTTLNSKTDLWGNIGSDVQYGITSGITLNATVNPDFGQVEADPARLNLSAYEEFFEERRPFFVEGASIFSSNDYNFFYTRRIGRQPGHFDLPEGAKELSRPEATTILGAAKIAGRTQSKTSFGIMEAVTSPEYAQIEEAGKDDKFLVEPLTNYFVGRVKQDVLGNSYVGLIGTAVNRQASNAAYVGGLDWDLKFAKERYQISGTLAASQAGKMDERKSGYLAHLEFDKRGGWMQFDTDFRVLSPDLEMNDLGFRRRADMLEWNYDFTVRKGKPFSVFRRVIFGLYGWRTWNYDGVSISRYSEIWTDGRLKNYWDYDLWIGRNLESFSDDDTMRGGTLIKSPPGWWIFTALSTDSRKMIQLRLNPVFAWNDDRRSYDYDVRLWLRIRLASNIEVSFGPSYNYGVQDAQWVDLVEENIDGHIEKHYVYGELERRTLDFTTRANISFTPTLSLQFYVQPFVTIGDYANFKELIEPKSYQFKPYALNENRDFHRRSLRGNTVLRWEFRPGSTLFLVWTQSREAELEQLRTADLEFRPLHRLRNSFTDEGKNVFLIKCRYWLGV
ncbi:MAG: DUF5916 domain-containing protein [Candidatus Poribacteria bacterium]|nr:DUF5916 domain-containing protein [Candidatus Poribacteria bacterium]MDE0425613.1 DUF5916 domain-containing protein [Candidatus Poribacteria bacterium]